MILWYLGEKIDEAKWSLGKHGIRMHALSCMLKSLAWGWTFLRQKRYKDACWSYCWAWRDFLSIFKW